MLLTIHLLIGALFGKYIKSIYLIIILALLSHYILDAIPHAKMTEPPRYKEYGLKGTEIKDILIRLIEPIFGIILFFIIIYLNKEKAIPMIIGGFFAFMPDLIGFIGWKFDLLWLRNLIPSPGNLFYREAKSLFVGIITHIIVGIPALIFLLPKIKFK